MIVLYDVIIGNIGIIVFQLTEWVTVIEKSLIEVYEECKCMLAFSYPAIPTRHEVHIKPIE